MSEDLEKKAQDLVALLEKAFGADPSASLPEDPWELNTDEIHSWQDIAAVLGAYPKGLPVSKKNALIARCMELTRSMGPNPDLSVQAARMPILGGHTTRVARQLVQSGPAKRRRTGLTRQSSSAGVSTAMRGGMHGGGSRDIAPPPTPDNELFARSGADGKNAGATATPAASNVSAQKLRQLEVHARMQQAKLDETDPQSPVYHGLREQTGRAWSALRDALQSRLNQLQSQNGTEQAITAYQHAIAQVATLIQNLAG